MTVQWRYSTTIAPGYPFTEIGELGGLGPRNSPISKSPLPSWEGDRLEDTKNN
jgi:hypothetical protein